MAMQFRRGNEADLVPGNLKAGEPAFTLDTFKTFVGTGSGASELLNTARYAKGDGSNPNKVDHAIAADSATTQSSSDSSNKIATTAFVHALDNLKAPLSSPALTGTPTAPTPAAGDNSKKIATMEAIANAIQGLRNLLPVVVVQRVQFSNAFLWFDSSNCPALAKYLDGTYDIINIYNPSDENSSGVKGDHDVIGYRVQDDRKHGVFVIDGDLNNNVMNVAFVFMKHR